MRGHVDNEVGERRAQTCLDFLSANTKAVFVETIENPKYNVSPIREIAKIRSQVRRRTMPANIAGILPIQ